jgi:hypothetical protein
MGQMYLQKFVYRDGVAKADIDAAWAEAFRAMARTGNYGNVDKGVAHQRSLGSAWGGYVLIEVDDPDSFAAYQVFHMQNYGHVAHITWEPVYDTDRVFAGAVAAAL